MFRAHRLLRFAVREPSLEAKFASRTVSKSNVKLPSQLFINNQFIDGNQSFKNVCPIDGTVLNDVSLADAKNVDAAVTAAHDAFYTGPWRSMSPRERGACLYKLADLIESQVDELAFLETLDNGKPIWNSENIDAPASASILRYYAGWADKINGKTIPIGPQHQCLSVHEPVGICGLIIPWNLPLIGVAAKLGPALACGNTVVLKPAEQTPLTALAVARLVEEAGFPPGVVNIISGDGPTTGEALVSHPLVNKIGFTGSTPVGKRIMAKASEHMKRVTLELGGKNPIVVCADADVDTAVQAVHDGLFWNDGEACAAGSRVFIEDGIYDEFVEKSTKLAAARKVGNPFDADAKQGSQVSEEQMDKILGYIQGAKADGAELTTGGQRVGTNGFYIEPTVFANVVDNMAVFKEEVFGPVLTLNRFTKEDGLDDIIRRANDSPYGLAAGIFTKDIATGHELSKRIRAGMVFWNCYHVVDVAAPFGGFKQSGMGREGGDYGLLPYLEVKMITQNIA